MTRPASFDRELLAARSSLYAFARSLTRNADDANDLVQDTLIKALVSWQTYTPDTKMGAWVFTIARNLFMTQRAKAKRQRTITVCALLDDGDDADKMKSTLIEQPGAQEPTLLLKETLRFVESMPAEQRESLLMIASGETYEDVAKGMYSTTGTIKSRVNRARARLQEAVA